MNSNQARRYLARRGCTFEPAKGGHLVVRRGKLWTVLPMHGSRRDIPKPLWLSILKALELEQK
jgi:mRNA interferase HicA